MKHTQRAERKAGPRLKWWQWAAVGLMLLAMGTYVLTLDDSVVPEAGVKAPAAGAGGRPQ